MKGFFNKVLHPQQYLKERTNSKPKEVDAQKPINDKSLENNANSMIETKPRSNSHGNSPPSISITKAKSPSLFLPSKTNSTDKQEESRKPLLESQNKEQEENIPDEDNVHLKVLGRSRSRSLTNTPTETSRREYNAKKEQLQQQKAQEIQIQLPNATEQLSTTTVQPIIQPNQLVNKSVSAESTPSTKPTYEEWKQSHQPKSNDNDVPIIQIPEFLKTKKPQEPTPGKVAQEIEWSIRLPLFPKVKLYSKRLRSSQLIETFSYYAHPSESATLLSAPPSLQDKLSDLVSSGVFTEIDRIATQVPENIQKGGTSKLVRYLIEKAANDFQKVRAIFVWITSHISLDYSSYLGKETSTTAKETFAARKASCEGFANLFQHFCSLIGLECFVVPGWALPTNLDSVNDEVAHVWNAVRLYDFWYLVDTMFGAGTVDTNGVFHQKRDDFYFLTFPSRLIYTHFPEWQSWQLKNPVTTKEQFQAKPLVYSAYWKYQLAFVNNVQANITCFANRALVFTFESPSNVRLTIKLKLRLQSELRLLSAEQTSKIITVSSESLPSPNRTLWTWNLTFDSIGNFNMLIYATQATQANDDAADSCIEYGLTVK